MPKEILIVTCMNYPLHSIPFAWIWTLKFLEVGASFVVVIDRVMIGLYSYLSISRHRSKATEQLIVNWSKRIVLWKKSVCHTKFYIMTEKSALLHQCKGMRLLHRPNSSNPENGGSDADPSIFDFWASIKFSWNYFQDFF